MYSQNTWSSVIENKRSTTKWLGQRQLGYQL